MANKIKVEIHKKPESRRKDSFWFDGHVATVSDGKTTVNIIATGHIKVCFNQNESNYSNDFARKEARSRGYTDVKLKNLSKHDGWSNNNWFDFEIIGNGKTFLDDYTDINLDDAIFYAKEVVQEANKVVTNPD